MLESIHPKNSKATKRNFSLLLRLVRVRARIPIVRESGYSVEIERVSCHDGHHGCGYSQRSLERVKHLFWHGNTQEALERMLGAADAGSVGARG